MRRAVQLLHMRIGVLENGGIMMENGDADEEDTDDTTELSVEEFKHRIMSTWQWREYSNRNEPVPASRPISDPHVTEMLWNVLTFFRRLDGNLYQIESNYHTEMEGSQTYVVKEDDYGREKFEVSLTHDDQNHNELVMLQWEYMHNDGSGIVTMGGHNDHNIIIKIKRHRDVHGGGVVGFRYSTDRNWQTYVFSGEFPSEVPYFHKRG